MSLWVLVYKIGEIELFLTPHGESSQKPNEAVKFTDYESAVNHKESSKLLLSFSPMQMSFDFKE